MPSLTSKVSILLLKCKLHYIPMVCYRAVQLNTNVNIYTNNQLLQLCTASTVLRSVNILCRLSGLEPFLWSFSNKVYRFLGVIETDNLTVSNNEIITLNFTV